jgi:tetratricopeptide (TPR) repeat protein
MKKNFILGIIIYLIPFFCYATISFNEDSVYLKATEYTNRLTDYCSCQGIDWLNKMENVVTLFGEPFEVNQELYHAYDLFNSFTDEDSTNTTIAGYLLAIKYFYDNNIKVTFSNITVTNCTIGNLVLVSAEKKITYGKLSKIVPIIIDIDVSTSPYSLRSVQMLYKENIPKCNQNKSIAQGENVSKTKNNENTTKQNAPSIIFENHKYFNYYSELADEKFNRGSFSKALRYYKISLKFQPDNKFVKSMISKCESIRSNSYSSPNLSITHGFPNLLEPNKEYIGTVTFSYDDDLVGQDAILEINLPSGCSANAAPSLLAGVTIEHSDQKIKFIWNYLPRKIPFMIIYNIFVSPNNANSIQGKTTGSFSYRTNGTMTTERFENNFFQTHQLEQNK